MSHFALSSLRGTLNSIFLAREDPTTRKCALSLTSKVPTSDVSPALSFSCPDGHQSPEPSDQGKRRLGALLLSLDTLQSEQIGRSCERGHLFEY
ncbi:hypothetical protein CEXT_673341 [Caerostris extrusa]|uniref:Uncharacterized protein n=1 Tax=Caerostris extrusa TaxID=172846 RepID=A0AAV4Y8Z4_CAEEX|nr:hypothetical protein CEXT_673341 [Caerostris extrusa]